jgi:hypothetical protein
MAAKWFNLSLFGEQVQAELEAIRSLMALSFQVKMLLIDLSYHHVSCQTVGKYIEAQNQVDLAFDIL